MIHYDFNCSLIPARDTYRYHFIALTMAKHSEKCCERLSLACCILRAQGLMKIREFPKIVVCVFKVREDTGIQPMGMILTAPVLVLSMLQSGMIFDRVTIQLLILSLLRLSTARGSHKSWKFLLCIFFYFCSACVRVISSISKTASSPSSLSSS